MSRESFNDREMLSQVNERNFGEIVGDKKEIGANIQHTDSNSYIATPEFMEDVKSGKLGENVKEQLENSDVKVVDLKKRFAGISSSNEQIHQSETAADIKLPGE